MNDALCPRCEAPRQETPDCPRCGVIYAKAQARRVEVAEAPVFAPVLETQPSVWDGYRADALLEFRIRLFAVPVAFLLAMLVMSPGMLAAVGRVFLSMWVHELGHAITAWFCGLFAVPGPWLTMVGDSRSFVVALMLAAALGTFAWRGYRQERRGWLVTAGALFTLQLGGTLLVSMSTAQMLVTFGGDAALFVLGGLLMASMYAREDSQIRKGWLRWGFLVIGAVAFADGLHTWWAASNDFAAIPFGRNEGAGLSDATKLVDRYGWSATQLIGRYLKLALFSGMALVGLYAWGIYDGRRRLRMESDASD